MVTNMSYYEVLEILKKYNLVISKFKYENLLPIDEFRFNSVVQFFIGNKRYFLYQEKSGKWFLTQILSKTKIDIKNLNCLTDEIRKKIDSYEKKYKNSLKFK